MKLQEYFSDLPNRLSANFLALIGFVNFMCMLLILIPGIKELLFGDILAVLFFSIVAFGLTTLLVICFLSIPFFLLLESQREKTTLIAGIVYIIIFIVILYCDFSAFVGLLSIYVHYNAVLFLIFLSLIIFIVIDNKIRFPIKNTLLINNKNYKLFVRVFYCYFWILYIPFAFGLFILLII
mgnify:CR=1 FL=1